MHTCLDVSGHCARALVEDDVDGYVHGCGGTCVSGQRKHQSKGWVGDARLASHVCLLQHMEPLRCCTIIAAHCCMCGHAFLMSLAVHC